MTACLIVARKEIRDHLRDTRSLTSTAVYALMGPVVVMLVSFSRAVEGGGGPRVLLSMASVFALVAAFAGGMNVAMDSMAGERERRSLVPLLLTPVSRFDLVIGKWIAANVFGVGAVGLTVGGLTYSEIAEVLGIAESNVGARLTRARAMLRRWVGFLHSELPEPASRDCRGERSLRRHARVQSRVGVSSTTRAARSPAIPHLATGHGRLRDYSGIGRACPVGPTQIRTRSSEPPDPAPAAPIL